MDLKTSDCCRSRSKTNWCPFANFSSTDEDEPEVVDLGTTAITLDDLNISLDDLEDDAPAAKPAGHDPFGLLA